jgi:hypothetical protein
MVIEMPGPRHRDSTKTTTISMDPAVLKPLLGSNIKHDYYMFSTNQGRLAEGEGLVPLTSRYPLEWKGINRKQSTRWQHLSRLKASAFFSLQKKFSCYKTQQLTLGTGIAIWWLTEPH